MLSFDNFLQTEGMPIYLQIIRYIKQGLVAGTVQDGEELPSRRVLSALLAVSINRLLKMVEERPYLRTLQTELKLEGDL